MSKHDLPSGTLDLLVLRTLSLGALHVYAIGQHIERSSGDAFTLDHGSLYPALERLLGAGYVTSKWGKSPTGRKARYYTITASGRKQLGQEIASYDAQHMAIARILGELETTQPMSWIDGLRHKLSTVFRPGEYEREIRDEMRAHSDLLSAAGDQRIRNATYHIEEARQMTWLVWLDLLRQDTSYAWRSIKRTPGVSMMIVITLALGIGVNAAVFNVLDQLYLRPPAGVSEPGDLRRVWTKHTRTDGGANFFSRAMAYPQYKVLLEQWRDSANLAVMILRSDFKLGGRRDGVSTNILFVSANYFPVLGLHPARGRFFTPAESEPGSDAKLLVVSHRFWKTALGGDETIVGRRIKLDTSEWEVIGVAPEGFDGLDKRPEQAWAPLGGLPGAIGPNYETGSIWTSPRRITFFTFGRVTPAMNIPDFERRVTAAMRDANKGFYGAQADTLSTLQTASIIESRGPATPRQEEAIVTRLQVVAILVLIIAVANVVNLLLARAVSRRREIAVRLALGISRSRLIRLITIESIALAMLSAAAALIAAWWGGALLRSQLMADINFVQPAMHAHVVWITLGSALLCGLVAGVIPAVQYSRPQLTNDLKDGQRGAGRQRSRLRSGLVMAQAALSVTLLVGATLLVRTLQNVEQLDIGFNSADVFYANMSYDPGGAPPMEERLAKIDEVEAQLRGRTGVAAVGRTALLPMGGFSFWTFWWGSDSSQSLRRQTPVAYAVASTFFSASGIKLLEGRVFDAGPAGESQVVVNEALAQLLWPGGQAIGQCLRFEKRDAPCTTVTGIVATARRDDVIERPQPQYYVPIGTKMTASWGGTILVVRTDPGASPNVERETTALLKAALPMGYPVIRPMTEILEPKYRPWRLSARLFTGVGILALIVALVGIYSTVSYSVGQRAHEFGVRMALGAHVKDVLNQVVGEGTRIVAIGIGIGIVLSMLGARLIASMLYGVEPTDVSAMILAAAVLLMTAIVASAIPAWRASRADPVKALRGE